MSRFENIKLVDMDKFLVDQGFRKISIPGTHEVVYGKRADRNNFPLSLRVYSAINPSGDSRQKGTDAIRIQLYMRYNDDVKPVGKAQKCLRVKNWQKNMQRAIDSVFDEKNWSDCPACGSPRLVRTNSQTQEEFWACVTYFETKCTGRPNGNQNQKRVVD